MRIDLLPHPLLSAGLLAVWLLLRNTVDAVGLLSGAFLAFAIPLGTQRFWPDRPIIRRLAPLVPLAATVAWDILTANFTVARIVLGPRRLQRPAFVLVPVDLEEPFALTLLANIISLSPGTVSADITEDRRTLVVHALAVKDRAALVTRIKHRYERPLKEVFEC